MLKAQRNIFFQLSSKQRIADFQFFIVRINIILSISWALKYLHAITTLGDRQEVNSKKYKYSGNEKGFML